MKKLIIIILLLMAVPVLSHQIDKNHYSLESHETELFVIPDISFHTYHCKTKIVLGLLILAEIEGEVSCSDWIIGCPEGNFQWENDIDINEKPFKDLDHYKIIESYQTECEEIKEVK